MAILRNITAIAAAALLATSVGGNAQPAPPQQQQVQPPPGPGSSTDEQHRPDSLSNDLSRSHGVIPPPANGDRNVVPTPNAGSSTMPVIPPPGTPGGNQDVQPK